MKIRFFYRTSLAMTVGLSILPPCVAGEVPAGKQISLLGSNGGPAEDWIVQRGATLTLKEGASARSILSKGGLVEVYDGSRVMGADVGLWNDADSMAFISGSLISGGKVGLNLSRGNGPSPTFPGPGAMVVDSELTGGDEGSITRRNGQLTLKRTRSIGKGERSVGARVERGRVEMTDYSTMEGGRAGLLVSGEGLSGKDPLSVIDIDRSTVRGRNGAAIEVAGVAEGTVYAKVNIGDDVSLFHSGDVAFLTGAGTDTSVRVGRSIISGDFVSTGGAHALLQLTNGSMLSGRVLGNVDVIVDAGGTLDTFAGGSLSSVDLRGGALSIGDPAAKAAALRVGGAFHARDGHIVLWSDLGIRSGIEVRGTDQLLIEGDANVQRTSVAVLPVGAGSNTDTNGNGRVDANEGISLIQVGGTASRDAFVLDGGYLAVGGYQYELKSFGPDEADASESRLESGRLGWDYRLATRLVCEGGCDPNDGVGNEEGPPKGVGEGTTWRPAVAPQIASYLSAPAAFLGYDRVLAGGLVGRLGDIRRGDPSGNLGGELFVRTVSSHAKYASNHSFVDYGYAFDQRIDALQLGGSIVALDGDNGSLRAGWGWDHGSTSVSPRAADGDSMARYRAYGVSAWVTWQHGDGAWLDGWVSSRRYAGNLDTVSRGRHAARVTGRTRAVSLEGGWPVVASADWTIEPRVQVTRTSLTSAQSSDVDGLTASMSPLSQTDVTAGVRVTGQLSTAIQSYVEADATGTYGGKTAWRVGSAGSRGASFNAGKLGSGYRLAAGAASQLGESVHLYAQVDYRHGLAGAGLRSLSFDAGLRVSL